MFMGIRQRKCSKKKQPRACKAITRGTHEADCWESHGSLNRRCDPTCVISRHVTDLIWLTDSNYRHWIIHHAIVSGSVIKSGSFYWIPQLGSCDLPPPLPPVPPFPLPPRLSPPPSFPFLTWIAGKGKGAKGTCPKNVGKCVRKWKAEGRFKPCFW